MKLKTGEKNHFNQEDWNEENDKIQRSQNKRKNESEYEKTKFKIGKKKWEYKKMEGRGEQDEENSRKEK